jgi:hypothetical protein
MGFLAPGVLERYFAEDKFDTFSTSKQHLWIKFG